MIITNGKIKEIEVEGDEITKKILTLEMGENEQCFVEVRSKYLQGIVDKLDIDDLIQVVIVFEGKISKSSGYRFNNLVVQTIKKLS